MSTVSKTHAGWVEVAHKDALDNLHRSEVEGPALAWRMPHGTKGFEWFLHGERHRHLGPATITGYEQAARLTFNWYTNGESARLDGPVAAISNGFLRWGVTEGTVATLDDLNR